MISNWSNSRLAKSSRFSFWKISADSLRCLAAFINNLFSASEEISAVAPFSVSASKIIDLMLRRASSSSLFLASIALLMSLSIVCFRLIVSLFIIISKGKRKEFLCFTYFNQWIILFSESQSPKLLRGLCRHSPRHLRSGVAFERPRLTSINNFSPTFMPDCEFRNSWMFYLVSINCCKITIHAPHITILMVINFGLLILVFRLIPWKELFIWQ